MKVNLHKKPPNSPILGATNRARRQSGFPTFIPCQRQDTNVLPKRRQSHQGDKLCDVSTVPLVARWPADLTRTANPIVHEPSVLHKFCRAIVIEQPLLCLNLSNLWLKVTRSQSRQSLGGAIDALTL